MLRIPRPLDRNPGGGGLDLLQVRGGEIDRRRSEVLLEPLELPGAGDGHDPRLPGPLIVDDVELLIRAAIDGVGLAFASEELVAPHLASGKLERVLEDWCPPFPGFFLDYRSRRQQPAALVALIEALRL